MDAEIAHNVLTKVPLRVGSCRCAGRALTVASSSLLLMVGITLVARRCFGALIVPLDPTALLATGALLSIIAWSIRAAARHRISSRGRALSELSSASDRLSDRFDQIAPAAALLMAGAALSLPGTPTLVLGLFWATIVLSQLDAQFGSRRNWARVLRSAGRQRNSSETLPEGSSWRGRPDRSLADREPDGSRDIGEFGGEFGTEANDLDEHIIQQLTRVHDATYGEMMYGTLRADLEPNQRSISLHVAFCPPFAKVPQMDIEQATGSEAQLKIGQLLAYGARIDLRLQEAADEPQSVIVELSVRERQQ
jgi:hypothetical protein